MVIFSLLHENSSCGDHWKPLNETLSMDPQHTYWWINTCEPRHEISNNVVGATSKGSDQPAHTRSLIRAFAGRLNIL